MKSKNFKYSIKEQSTSNLLQILWVELKYFTPPWPAFDAIKVRKWTPFVGCIQIRCGVQYMLGYAVAAATEECWPCSLK